MRHKKKTGSRSIHPSIHSPIQALLSLSLSSKQVLSASLPETYSQHFSKTQLLLVAPTCTHSCDTSVLLFPLGPPNNKRAHTVTSPICLLCSAESSSLRGWTFMTRREVGEQISRLASRKLEPDSIAFRARIQTKASKQASWIVG